MKIRGFEWDNQNIHHIAKHNITPEEVEEAFLNALFRKSRDGRLLAYGLTDAGRYVLVVVALKTNGIARIITARNMTKSEKRYYLREKGV